LQLPPPGTAEFVICDHTIEMVFRALYHFSRAVQRGETETLVDFLAAHAALLGLVKRQRKRDRERLQQDQLVWGGS
jgi:hypothetical protein